MKLWKIAVPLSIVVAVFCAFIMFGTNPYVPPGHEGYVRENPRFFGKGGFQGVVIGPGNYGRSLFRNEVECIDMRPITYDEKLSILAADQLTVGITTQIIMSVRPNSVSAVIEQYGSTNFYKRFIQKKYRAIVREVVQREDSRSISMMRSEISATVKELLLEYLKGSPFVLSTVTIGDVTYPKVVTDAVEQKLSADQQLQKKQTELEIAKKDAEIEIARAQGIADAQKIIDETLTPGYLQYKAIEAQLQMADSPNNTIIYVPVGQSGLPMVTDPMAVSNRTSGKN